MTISHAGKTGPGGHGSSASQDLEQELRSALSGEVRFDSYSKAMYSTDASIYRMEPVGVVVPRDADDVSAVLEIATRSGVKVLPRGGGTSLSGQTVNHAVVMDFSKYMHNVLEVNPEERWVRTQPGVTIDDLNRQLRSHRLFFTPDPSTSSRANVGGAMGNNSCGSHSIIYGKTVDHVIEMDVVLSDGTPAHLGQISAGILAQKRAGTGLEAEIYRRVPEIAAAAAGEVDRRFPKILRRVGGYNLDLVQDPSALNLVKMAVGSEGTLLAVTSAKLNLEPIPPYSGIAVIHFKDIIESMEATVATLEEEPAAVEHIGEMIIREARNSIGFSRNLGFLHGEPSDILVVEMNGETPGEVEAKLDRLEQKMRRLELGYATTRLVEPAQMAQVWNMRKAGLGLMMNIEGDAKPLPFVEDTAVSPERLPEYVRRFDEIVRSHGTEAGYYGHASVGCLHIRPVVNLKTAEGAIQMERIADEISDLVLEFGGALSAEHGDGIVRGAWAEKMFGRELVQNFRDVKQAFDPKGTMNPGKVFDTPPMTANLRYGVQYKTVPVKTRLDFSREGGFAGAIEKCNGVGDCRKVNAGAMCPSYQATREEEHSTRGRANALRAAISGALPVEQLNSKRMFNVLDLCLECKSCKSECPSNVDMAKIKYEFLNTYYKTHRVPLRSRVVANIHRLNALAAGPQARMANALNRSFIGRMLSDRLLKMDKRRKLPAIASQTFESWFKRRTPNTTGSRGKIVFFHDTFINFNHPEAGIGATRLLEALGYEVVLADRKCCGRPMVSKGLLDMATANARYNVDSLYEHVAQGAKIAGCESSCMMAIKDEYPDLLPGDEKAKAVAEAVVMVEELIAETAGDGMQQIEWGGRGRPERNVRLFVHCHERALVGTQSALRALSLPPNFKASMIEAGCCGMAGSFGFEKEHYDVSMKVGEERLFPAIRSAPRDAEIAVTGVSCRQQIEDGTGRSARYLTEVLAEALPD
ncbi:MAG: FAD-binding protein [Chloroflexi bacterium]|nr:FAD-binding protein [Chloroflexota bacterium]MDA1296753.1 FAD-binding protein [Chloroflexota bacterium]